ncbi:LysR family transcriptional regulator [Pseudomonas fluorescens]|uniref:LysR family transcriptional regulator n=1 Tax=Pseudomonas fluorescens TaxID=294 RepID=UPI001241EA0E|nr:LysR family transcriptional regulator [Pseudomonas fluorescens]VVN09279.1 HTH-type transcriptional regulator YhaJ [Pseudomonas fluorescens]
MLSIEDLALLEAIRETGSLSRAAVHLGKAPSTVSYAARQLEERFDALLFDRRRYRLQLTPAGELLVNEAARLMQDVSRLTQRVQQVANGWESRLWIVTDELLEFDTLIPVIHEFDALESGVPLRITQEVLKGVWEALREGRADLIIGATNEPPAIPSLRWMQLGEMEWVFAVSPSHPLARAREPISRATVTQHRAIVVADSSRATEGSTYGVTGGQPVLAVPTMRAKILAQCDGLGVGWLPKHRVGSLLKNGTLVAKQMAVPREPNILYAGWRGDHDGRALGWWLEKLKQSYLATKLVQGSGGFA